MTCAYCGCFVAATPTCSQCGAPLDHARAGYPYPRPALGAGTNDLRPRPVDTRPGAVNQFDQWGEAFFAPNPLSLYRQFLRNSPEMPYAEYLRNLRGF